VNAPNRRTSRSRGATVSSRSPRAAYWARHPRSIASSIASSGRNLDPAGVGHWLSTDEPDQHVTAARHGKLRREPRPGSAGQRERDLDQRLRQWRDAAGERRGQPRDLLGERGLPAPGADALEPADVRDHLHPTAAERKVG
jgi:hypothetical protein